MTIDLDAGLARIEVCLCIIQDTEYQEGDWAVYTEWYPGVHTGKFGLGLT
jgi:hypothetical protein